MEAYLLAFSLLVLVVGLVAPKLNNDIPLGIVQFCLISHGYGLLLCIVAFGFGHVPRVVQITILSAVLMLAILFVVTMFILINISQEHLASLMKFLTPLSWATWGLLAALALVSVVGWIRFFQKVYWPNETE